MTALAARQRMALRAEQDAVGMASGF